jgi:hypothetical protein
MGEGFMDNFELKPERKKVNWKPLVWNFLTLLVLLSVCGLAYYFWTIFNNPNSPINPFPPAPLPTSYQTVTATSTIIPLEPTWTFTPTIQPVASRTKAPTWTLLPQMITPSVTSTPTLTLMPTITPTPMPASAVITFVASTTLHPDKKCAWIGVAGKVFGTDGKALLSQQIQLGGTLEGTAISYMTLSGLATTVGPSGFEFILGDHPVASSQTLWIQLLDNAGKQLTNKVYFDTKTDCTQNLVMVVFTKTR